MATEAQIRANEKYRKEKCDRVIISVPKGKREEYKAKAAKFGLSLTKLIQNSVESYGERCAVVTSEQKKFLDEFNQLPADGQRLLVKFLQSVNRSVNPGTEFVAESNKTQNQPD